jgi:hypothetical protein
MTRLLQKKSRAVEQLRRLAEHMLVGSASETYRTCGQPTCRCHTSGPKHGPNMYVNYRGPEGRTTGYYVPEALHEPVRRGLDAWKQFQALAKEVARINRQILLETHRSSQGHRGRK